MSRTRVRLKFVAIKVVAEAKEMNTGSLEEAKVARVALAEARDKVKEALKMTAMAKKAIAESNKREAASARSVVDALDKKKDAQSIAAAMAKAAQANAAKEVSDASPHRPSTRSIRDVDQFRDANFSASNNFVEACRPCFKVEVAKIRSACYYNAAINTSPRLKHRPKKESPHIACGIVW